MSRVVWFLLVVIVSLSGCVAHAQKNKAGTEKFHTFLSEECFQLHKANKTLLSDKEALEDLYRNFDMVSIRDDIYMDIIAIYFLKADGSEKEKMYCTYSKKYSEFVSLGWRIDGAAKDNHLRFPIHAALKEELRQKALSYPEEKTDLVDVRYYPMRRIMKSAIITLE